MTQLEVNSALTRSTDTHLDFTTASTAKLSDLNTTARKLNGLPIDPDLEGAYNPFDHRDQKKTTSDSGALLHMLKSSLGSGILAMPMAFKNAGLLLGAVGTIVVGILCTYCVHMLVHCSQVLSARTRTPKLSFADTAKVAFAHGPAKFRAFENIAKEFVNMALFFTYYLGNTVYIVFIASSFKQVLDNHMGFELNIRIYILLICIPLIPLGIIRNLKNLVLFSAVATIFIIVGIAFTLYFTVTDLPDTSTRHNVAPITQFPLFFCTVLFAMEGIGTVLPIENSMKTPGHFLGKFGVLNIAMAVVIAFYSMVGYCGYLKYGDDTKGSITLNLPKDALSELIKVLVALSILFTYGLQFGVPSEIVWERIKHKVPIPRQEIGYYIMRGLMIIGTVMIGAIIPNLGPIISLVGAVCFSLLGLFCPAVIDYVTFYDPNAPWYNPRSLKNIIIIIISLGALVSGTYYSLEEVIDFYAKNPFI